MIKITTNIVTKFFCLIICSTAIFAMDMHDPDTYQHGKLRVLNVMHKGPGGIYQTNANILFAETKNLKQDLNLAEISARFGCKTIVGKEFIALFLEKLISPDDTSHTIEHRQQIIKMLVENPEIRQRLDDLLQQAVEHELAIMQFLQDRKNYIINNGQMNFFDFIDHVNGRYALLNTFSKVSAILAAYFAGDVVQSKVREYYNLPSQQKWQSLQNFFEKLGFNDTFGKFTFFLSSARAVPAILLSLYKHYMKDVKVRDFLYSFNRLIDISEQIEQVSKEYGLNNQFKLSSIRSTKGLYLLNGLKNSRYQSKDSYFVITPLVHEFMYEMYENDETLAPLYASIAELDAYNAIAQKMVSFQGSDNKLCFVEFVQKEKPFIDQQGFWNILVTVNKPVINTLVEDRNIILTGPNEGGKTTAIRSLLQNIVLAQTFGIAAASQCKITQFDAIHSYLTISDDILQGKSRFASELVQAKTILQRIKRLLPTEKFFFALDEMFTGTNGEDGAQCAYQFINNIASYSGIQFIYATHFNKLKEISSVNKACVNYKINPPLRDATGKFLRDNNGQLIYPYTIGLGVNDVNVAIYRAQDAGIFS